MTTSKRPTTPKATPKGATTTPKATPAIPAPKVTTPATPATPAPKVTTPATPAPATTPKATPEQTAATFRTLLDAVTTDGASIPAPGLLAPIGTLLRGANLTTLAAVTAVMDEVQGAAIDAEDWTSVAAVKAVRGFIATLKDAPKVTTPKVSPMEQDALRIATLTAGLRIAAANVDPMVLVVASAMLDNPGDHAAAILRGAFGVASGKATPKGATPATDGRSNPSDSTPTVVQIADAIAANPDLGNGKAHPYSALNKAIGAIIGRKVGQAPSKAIDKGQTPGVTATLTDDGVKGFRVDSIDDLTTAADSKRPKG